MDKLQFEHQVHNTVQIAQWVNNITKLSLDQSIDKSLIGFECLIQCQRSLEFWMSFEFSLV